MNLTVKFKSRREFENYFILKGLPFTLKRVFMPINLIRNHKFYIVELDGLSIVGDLNFLFYRINKYLEGTPKKVKEMDLMLKN